MKRLLLIIILIFLQFSKQDLNAIEYSPTDIYVRFEKDANIEKLISRIKSEYYVSNLFYLKHPSASVKNKNNLKATKQLSEILKAEEPLLRTVRVSFDSHKSTPELAKELKKKYNEIEIAEAVVYPQLLSQSDFNDPFRSFQLLLSQIRAYQAWKIEDGDKEIVIGISDNGIKVNHPDLAPNTKSFTSEIPNNGIDDDQNGYIDDYNGFNLDGINTGDWGNAYTTGDHGTQVAGIVGAKPNNNEGIIGVANNCMIFPIKISLTNSPGTIPYGYESIIFAADRGLDILNCSWGSVKNYSYIEQSIIDYAVAKGLVIIGASGNDGNLTPVFKTVVKQYPSGYSGVIGVGSVNPGDQPLSLNSIGSNLHLLAPGEQAYTTTSSDSYTDAISGTSFAAPVVSGAAGLVKAKNPELNPKQILSFIRQMGFEMQFATDIEPFMPKRLDLLNAVTTDPFSIPGFEIISIEAENKIENERFLVGDEIDLRLTLKNHLGAGENLNFELSVIYQYTNNSIEVIDNFASIDNIETGDEIDLNFKLKSNEFNNVLTILRLDITGDNGYSDFLKFDFIPNPLMSTFENENYLLSIGDSGYLGFESSANEKVGLGVQSKAFGNQLWDGGLIVMSDKDIANSFGGDPISGFNDFNTIKPLSGAMKDSSFFEYEFQEQNLVGFSQVVQLSNENQSWFKLKYKVLSNQNLSDFAIGHFLDLDVQRRDISFMTNRLINGNDLIPDDITNGAAGAVGAYSPEENIYFGILAFSKNSNPKGFGLGFPTGDYSFQQLSFDKYKEIAETGNSISFSGLADIKVATGLYYDTGFNSSLQPECEFCFTVDNSQEKIKQNLRDCYNAILNVQTNINTSDFSIKGNVLVSRNFTGKINLDIFSLNGSRLMSKSYNISKGEEIILPITANGLYFARLKFNDKEEFLKFVIAN